MQDIIEGDSTCTARCTIWESDIGEMEEGHSYHLKRFVVKEYESQNYLSKGQEALISTIEDIGNTATFDEPENVLTTITEAQIVGVQQLDKYNFAAKQGLNRLTQDVVGAPKKTAKCFRNTMYVLSNFM